MWLLSLDVSWFEECKWWFWWRLTFEHCGGHTQNSKSSNLESTDVTVFIANADLEAIVWYS